jgi:hypothetical protein
MSSAHNAHPESGLWSNLHRKDGRVVAFIVCGLIASASGLVLQMAGHDANIDGRSIIAAVPLNSGTLLSTIVSPVSPATSAPDNRQVTVSPSNSPQTAPLTSRPTTVTVSTREAPTELAQQPVAASNSPQTEPLNASPTAVTGSTREATTGLPQQPVASNSPQIAPFNATPAAGTSSTREETTGLPQWPAAASNESQKAVRSPKQRNHARYDAAAWGRYAPSW